MEWGFDGNNFAITVSDAQGLLRLKDVVNHLMGVTPAAESQSFGLGLRTVFERSLDMFITVKKGQETSVTIIKSTKSQEPRSFKFLSL